MDFIPEKTIFIRDEFMPLVEQLAGHEMGSWGKMNAQQMVEHVTGFFKISINKLQFPLLTPEEQLPMYRDFLYSEKQFRENTKAPVLPADPLPLNKSSMEEALIETAATIRDFFGFFAKDPQKTTIHPVFGPLNFEEWIQLHHKHVTHHARQFGLLPKK